MLNKSKGNMYPWVTHTWNAIKGKCPHDCLYCYMKRYPQKEIRLVESELNFDLGSGSTIFVGSSCDMWAKEVPDWWIDSVLACSRVYPQNTYLFQTKNPARFNDWENDFPPKVILGITLETNRIAPCLAISKAPIPPARMTAMLNIKQPKMVSIEPIMNFDVEVLTDWIKQIQPEFVSIGADSKEHHLPEPSGSKVAALIGRLQGITQVKIKDNLKRILRQ